MIKKYMVAYAISTTFLASEPPPNPQRIRSFSDNDVERLAEIQLKDGVHSVYIIDLHTLWLKKKAAMRKHKDIVATSVRKYHEEDTPPPQ